MSIPRRAQNPTLTPYIVLQRWCNYYPSMEFCLYIKGGMLKAISQKDTSVYYPFLKEKESELVPLLQRFVDKQVCPVFPAEDCGFGADS